MLAKHESQSRTPIPGEDDTFGDTLFVNMQGPPGLTFAIWRPWHLVGGQSRVVNRRS